MELLTIKIIALTLLGVFSLFFGLLPLRLRKVMAKGSRKRERIVSCLLCFGGGVLLATVFTHMLPETREGFAAALPEITYPLTEVIICAGFFLIYFIEELMHKGGSRGLITLVRKDLPATLTLAPPHLGEQVDSLCVTLHMDRSTKVDVCNVYCRQRSQLDLLPTLENNQRRLLVLSGDYNAHHPLLEPWSDGGSNPRGCHIIHMLEEFEELKLHGASQPTHIAGGRLDLTLTVNDSGHLTSVCGVHELMSDHWAQVSTIYLPRCGDIPAIPRNKWITRKADWKLFTEHLNTWYASYPVPVSVQDFAEDLTRAIHDAADASIPRQGKNKFNPNKKHLWYYDSKIKFLNKVSRQLTKNHHHTRTDESRHHLQDWALYARDQIALIREEKWLQFTGRLTHATNMTQVWRHVNRIRGKHSKPPAHPDPARKASELMRDYHERSANTNLPPNIKVAKTNLDPARLAAVTAATLLSDNTDEPITREEMLRAQKTSGDTAPGEDGITYSMLNAVCNVAGDPLLQLFNMSFSQGTLPKEWTTANIIPVPKSGADNQFRPISLTSTLCKMLERILLSRLTYKIGHLDTGVNGFVKHRSTANCLANYYANDKAKTAVFLDIEKAFDRAQPLPILAELTKLGVKGKLLLWVQQYLSDRKARVIFQGKASDYMRLDNGTPQGGVISPTLFNILMNVLARLPYPEGTQHIGYADDVVLQTTGRDSTTTMQESLNLLTDKCEEIGFTISQTKTKAMAKTRNAPLDTLRLQGQNVEWVATQRYLGVIVARNNGCKAEIQHLKDKCRARNRILRAMSWKGMGASGTVILSAYKSLVRSLVDYASPVLLHITTTDAKSLETIQNEALRTILGAPKWTKTENMRAETQVSSLTARLKVMTANFLIKSYIRADHPDEVHTQLHNHHEGHRGQGRWLKTAIETLQHSGVAWEAINTAVIPLERNATAPWEATLITTVVRPPRRKKRDCLPVELRQEGLQNIQGVREPYAAVYYTDGSTDPAEGRSGAAFVCKMGGEDPVATATRRVHTASARTSNFSSSTQTELTAISMALDHAHTAHRLNTLIVTDSMTAIACINKQDTENTHLTHAIRAAVKAIHNMGRSVTITWVASHVGITGNEEADALAK
ncbi:RNA-directed DNA polymerase from mobile element jockey [Chionoecetes opilio]|uniref:RNA-directed DNA polymerase from mobile element jockey n=1 Tax=Chionoecetes opilio TaxID=41210 RepID=A0A8J4XZI5_CHIOP|nr:RNA-directed DNA polymerase from mobile element jockey [Chionoecetes opilio]